MPPALGRAVGEALLKGRAGGSDGMQQLARWRQDVPAAVTAWAASDALAVPWAYPAGDPWTVAVGEILGDAQAGWPFARDVLDLAPRWVDATPEILNALAAMADAGPRRRAMQRLVRVAVAVRDDSDGWDGSQWMVDAGLGPSDRRWIDLLGWGIGVVASSAVLRVTARLTGTEVDVRNRMSNGRMELAKFVGDSDDAPYVNAALRRIGSLVCTGEVPSCNACPLESLCNSAR